MLEFELAFYGKDADRNLLEFYDASQALLGFQRSLALTTHLAIHGEIITQAPAASGFSIYIPPAMPGSWKTKAIIVFTTAVAVTSAGKDSPLGQVVTSLYDAALYNTMGFNVDYDMTLQEQFAKHQSESKLTAEKVDSLCEKIEQNVVQMHRPIVKSASANRAQISRCNQPQRDIGPLLNENTYEYVRRTIRDKEESIIDGYVSSYNINTYTGRIFSVADKRPIPFELNEVARSKAMVAYLTQSQHENGQERGTPKALIRLKGHKLLSPNGIIKKIIVTSVQHADING